MHIKTYTNDLGWECLIWVKLSKICLFCIILLLSVVFLTNLFTFSIDHLSDLDHLVLFKLHNQIMVILSQEKTK